MMDKLNWVTITFALERYIQELQNSNGAVTPHIWNTLALAEIEMDKAE